MKFSGRLQVEADARNWLKADLTVAKGRVELSAGDDSLGSWTTSQVTAERVEGDRFALSLGEEKAMFVADDALGFSYEALPQLNKRQLIPVGGVMDKIKSGLRTEEGRPGEIESLGKAPPDPSDSPATVTGKRLRELIREASRQTTKVDQPSPQSVSEQDPEPPVKRTSSFEGVFKRRAVARDHESESARLPLDSLEPSDFPADDLLERLFDPEPVKGNHDSLDTQAVAWPEHTDVEAPQLSEDEDAIESESEPLDDGGAAPTAWKAEATLAEAPEPLESPLIADALDLVETPSAGFWDDPVAVPASTGEDGLGWVSPFSPDEGARAPALTDKEEPFEPVDLAPERTEFHLPVERDEPDQLIHALDRIVNDARTGSLTPAQVEAIASLVEAVTAAVRTR